MKSETSVANAYTILQQYEQSTYSQAFNAIGYIPRTPARILYNISRVCLVLLPVILVSSVLITVLNYSIWNWSVTIYNIDISLWIFAVCLYLCCGVLQEILYKVAVIIERPYIETHRQWVESIYPSESFQSQYLPYECQTATEYIQDAPQTAPPEFRELNIWETVVEQITEQFFIQTIYLLYMITGEKMYPQNRT